MLLRTSCRSDPADELENADFIGLNAYLHCDGTLTDYTNLPGFVALLSDFQTYDTTVPVMVRRVAALARLLALLCLCVSKNLTKCSALLSIAI